MTVLERQGTYLKVTLADGIGRFIDSSSLSQVEEKFTPFDATSGIPETALPNCPVHTNRPVSTVYRTEPEYTDEARKADVQGTVVLSVVVGINGKPRNITVEKKLGHGLDKQAVEAVKQWRFEPALRDGEPVETTIRVELQFQHHAL